MRNWRGKWILIVFIFQVSKHRLLLKHSCCSRLFTFLHRNILHNALAAIVQQRKSTSLSLIKHCATALCREKIETIILIRRKLLKLKKHFDVWIHLTEVRTQLMKSSFNSSHTRVESVLKSEMKLHRNILRKILSKPLEAWKHQNIHPEQQSASRVALGELVFSVYFRSPHWEEVFSTKKIVGNWKKEENINTLKVNLFSFYYLFYFISFHHLWKMLFAKE